MKFPGTAVCREEFPVHFPSPVLKKSGQLKESVQEILPYIYCSSGLAIRTHNVSSANVHACRWYILVQEI